MIYVRTTLADGFNPDAFSVPPPHSLQVYFVVQHGNQEFLSVLPIPIDRYSPFPLENEQND